MQYDYVIVGAGSAGCVLANRLSANPTTRVCLLEAGPADDSLFVRVPAGIIVLMRSKKRNWRYWTVPQAHLDGRATYVPRGKTLGGSSSVNAMIYTRGHRRDYDHWAALGNTGWSYADVLPIFRRTENNARGSDAYHGVGGGLNVADLRFSHPVARAFVDAAVAAGYPYSKDFNGAQQEGVGLYQVTQTGGERSNVARGFLHPVEDRQNLTIIPGALTTRILMDGKRATGVEYLHRGRTEKLAAGTVILSAGAINSPQLLLLSGIGARAQLEPHGIRQVHDLPGVGCNLQDHPDILTVKRSQRHDTLSLGPRYGATTGPAAVAQYFPGRQGPLTSNVAESGGFIKSRDEEEIPDLQLHLSACLLDNHGLDLKFSMGWGYSAHVCILRPKSRGSVTLKSANPQTAPLIDPNFLADPDDMERLLRGVKIVRDRILPHPVLAPWDAGEVSPGDAVQGDDALRAFIRRKADTIYHPVGTCRMGSDDAAVVDANLKVHGLEGLYVVDASIMPTLIGGNTNAPTVMVADKAADGLIER
ncbi:MAG: choline dehydrogenase [Nevskiaceae bacterium]|nr:MAG: choline dehydrogenase [Nevskiaceae bacterium]TBR71628.1 MAG: choline dehydrogenase [Nevskiaceae bacterium]